MTTLPKVYTVRDVIVQLSVSKASVYRMVRTGRLRLIKIGPRASGITAESVEALLKPSDKPGSIG
jgi:excisionase family DNA binding protein